MNERTQEMTRLFKSGSTLQEIGNKFNITRERVRQIVTKCGLSANDGGCAIRVAKKRQQKIIEKMRTYLPIYKCLYGDFIQANSGRRSRQTKLARGFIEQRKNAKLRNIEWKLSFPEWVQIWKNSGHFNKRGKCRGQYVMSRYADKGAYEVNNVAIKTCSENRYEALSIRRGVILPVIDGDWKKKLKTINT